MDHSRLIGSIHNLQLHEGVQNNNFTGKKNVIEIQVLFTPTNKRTNKIPQILQMLRPSRTWHLDQHPSNQTCTVNVWHREGEIESKMPRIWVFPKNRDTPKWMVYNGKTLLNGWFGGTTILGNIHISTSMQANDICTWHLDLPCISSTCQKCTAFPSSYAPGQWNPHICWWWGSSCRSKRQRLNVWVWKKHMTSMFEKDWKFYDSSTRDVFLRFVPMFWDWNLIRYDVLFEKGFWLG